MKFVKIDNVSLDIEFYPYNSETTEHDCITVEELDEYRLYYIIIAYKIDFPKGLNMYFKYDGSLYRFTQINKDELVALKKLVGKSDVKVYDLTQVVGI